MIIIKSDPEVDLMRQAGRITAGARTVARQMVEPGVTTRQINREVHKFITKSGASPCFMTDGGFPTAACISVNDEIIHGIPGDRVLHEGDIVSVDVGARYRGFNGDCAGTFPCGKCSDEALRLIRITRQSFFEGIQFARVGYRISDIGHAVQEYAESYGYSLVRGMGDYANPQSILRAEVLLLRHIGRDRVAGLGLAVLPGIAEIRDDGGDAAGGGTLHCVDHDQQLHEAVIDRLAGALHDEHVHAADGLVDGDGALAVGKRRDRALAQGDAEVLADHVRQVGVGRAGEHLDLFAVWNHIVTSSLFENLRVLRADAKTQVFIQNHYSNIFAACKEKPAICGKKFFCALRQCLCNLPR